MKRKRILLINVAFLLLLASACYEDQEGCLDVNSLDFDVTADIDCNDCCTYPNLAVEFVHRVDTLSMQLDTLYTNNLDQGFRIRSVQYYLHDFGLINDFGTKIGISEKTVLSVYENGIIVQDSVSDNVILVNRNTIRMDLGSFSTPDEYPEMQFTIGLAEDMNRAVVDSIEASHPLGPKSDTMYIESDKSYYFIKMDLEDEMGNTYFVRSADLTQSVDLDYNEIINRGGEARLALVVDYKLWLEDVDFNTMSMEQINDLIVLNSKNSFSKF